MKRIYLHDEEYRMFQDLMGDAVDAFYDDPLSFSYPDSVSETGRVLGKLADHACLNMKDFGSESEAEFMRDLTRREREDG
jgi:hypothetical protein